MKKVCLVLLLVLLVSSYVSAASSNLLLNPSFEAEDHISNWSNESSTTFCWTQNWQHKDGDWAFGVGNDLDWASDNKAAKLSQILMDPNNTTAVYVPVDGEGVDFVGYAMVESGFEGEAYLTIEFYNYDATQGISQPPLSSVKSRVLKGMTGGEWARVSVKANAPAGTKSVVVSCVVQKMAKGSKYIWFDDLKVKAGN